MLVDHEEERSAARLLAITKRCAASRVYFCEKILKLTLEPWQREVFEALDNGETRISIRSGHGVGKTFTSAICAVHFLLFRPECKIVCTSPSSGQLNDGLYPECVKWINKLPPFLKDTINVITNRITRVDNAENAFISFRTARKETPEALAGIHSKHVLCIVDEASGVAEEVYEAAQGTLSTPGAIFLLIGNPTRLNGYFYNTHHKLSKYWFTRRVSSFDVSKVDMAFVQTIIDTYGKTHNQYKIRVLGDFPGSEDETLIARSLCDACIDRDITPNLSNIIWGVDPGRGNDGTGFCIRTNNAVLMSTEWQERDSMVVVGYIKDIWDGTPEKYRPNTIYIDSVGIGGPVADRLRELGLPAVDVNVGETAPLKQRYLRLRDNLWYSLKYWIESLNVVFYLNEQFSKEDADRLCVEISAPLELPPTATGKDCVEPKPAMKSRLPEVGSPDRADALMITFMGDAAIASGHVANAKRSNWHKPLEVNTSHII